jgi:hypothetical protein
MHVIIMVAYNVKLLQLLYLKAITPTSFFPALSQTTATTTKHIKK